MILINFYVEGVICMDKDWILRIKGKHAVTIYTDGEVCYSVGKKNLFYLTNNGLHELESLLKISLNTPNDPVTSNVIRFKYNKKVFTLYNRKLYTKIWKIVYDANNIKGNVDELIDIIKDIEYVIVYGDLLIEVPLDSPDPVMLCKLLDIDDYTDSLINLILTKNNEVYY